MVNLPPFVQGAGNGESILGRVLCADQSECARPLVVSIDSGSNWFETGPAGAEDPSAVGNGGWRAILVPSAATAILTSKDGVAWDSLASPCRDPWPATAATAWGSASLGLLACVGDEGAGQQAKAILSTADGGKTWTRVSSFAADGSNVVGNVPGHGELTGLWMTDGSLAWLSTADLYASTDGGRVWKAADPAVASDARRVLSARFHGPDGAVLVADDAAHIVALFATADRGATWAQKTTWSMPTR